MSEVLLPGCDEIDELVARYAYSAKLSGEERSRVEEHLKGCASCSELVFFVQKTMTLARKEPIRFEPPAVPCLSTDTFIALEDNTLDEETARKAKLHLLSCPNCREVFLKLRNLSEHRVDERVLEYMDAPRITVVFVRLAERIMGALETVRKRVLELVNISGAGHVLQSAATVSRGSDEESSSERVQIEDTVADSETKQSSIVRIRIDADPKGAVVQMRLQADPPQPNWKVSLTPVGSEELRADPIAERETLLGSDLVPGSYLVIIRKDENSLASFAVEVQAGA